MKLIFATLLFLAISLSSNSQNVGIGTTSPTAKLEVVGSVKIVDGTQGNGKVLTTDADGLASWSTKGNVQPNTFVISDVKNDATLLANNYTYKSSFNVNTKIAKSFFQNPERWTEASYFMAPTLQPKVINGAGNNFVCFGGYNGFKTQSSGGIYDPINDTWVSIPSMGDGAARSVPVVVWANGKLFVWGGFEQNGFTQNFYNTGRIYDSATRVWTGLTTVNAPAGRYIAAYGYNQATNEIAIWGGSGAGAYLGTGAKYNLTTNTWTTLPTLNAPSARSFMGFANGMGKLFIFGGIQNVGGNASTAHTYDFASNSWSTVPASGMPSRYNAHTAFTGNAFLVWGGNGAGVGNEGAIFNIASNSWNSMSTSGSPSGVVSCNTTFSNGNFIYAGSDFNYKYNIATNLWTALPDFELRGFNGFAGNDACLFMWGGKADYTSASAVKEQGARYFWTPQSITVNATLPEEYYLYKKN